MSYDQARPPRVLFRYVFHREEDAVVLYTAPVVKATRCGVWFRDPTVWPNKLRFTYLNYSKKRASKWWPTRIHALSSFLIRKDYQLRYMRAEIEKIELAVDRMKRLDPTTLDDDTYGNNTAFERYYDNQGSYYLRTVFRLDQTEEPPF